VSRHTGYVDNIDQFCDRWCAKCAMTARCEAFARARGDAPTGAADEVDDLEVLKNLRALVAFAVQALHSMAVSDPKRPPAPPHAAASIKPAVPTEPAPRPAPARAAIASAPWPPAARLLMLGVLGYLHLVRGWFDEERAWLEEKRRSFRTRASMSADPAAALAEAEALVDAVEAVTRDVALIPERIERAFDTAPADPKSADGHAKVALISMDRSVEAWLTIRRARQGIPETVVPLLHHLAQLRQQLEGAFPGARRFERPGLDATALPGGE